MSLENDVTDSELYLSVSDCYITVMILSQYFPAVIPTLPDQCTPVRPGQAPESSVA